MDNRPKFKTFAASTSRFTRNCQDCDVKKILEEIAYVEKIQSEVEYGNEHVFRSFQVRIEIDDIRSLV